MKILVIGSGAREHALVWALSRSPRVAEIMVCPGNAGMENLARRISLDPLNIEAIARLAQDKHVDLTVVGPEAPLVSGIADVFSERGLPLFGPGARAARIEGSKAWAKDLMVKHGIPTASHRTFSDLDLAKAYVSSHPVPVVVKADGLAAGKGVVVAQTRDEALAVLCDFMGGRSLGEAGKTIIVEEFLEGREFSLLGLTDGKTVLDLLPACDYKRACDGNRGPNTGGMGASCPTDFLSRDDLREGIRILKQTVAALEKEGCPYSGVLYGGFMRTSQGVRVLEFNCRFGDPETQVILPLLQSDLAGLLTSCAHGALRDDALSWSTSSAVGVVVAREGYPGSYKKGNPLPDLQSVPKEILVFHAGTERSVGELVNTGGRTLTFTAFGADRDEAASRAYEVLSQLSFSGFFFRSDIGKEVSFSWIS
ncbi:MAG: phosphoribosylamine--glycine ligase [Armatimonadetes bacterium]|nr:phosphoribosylamine--glycine ligase [Armatimonadota bacterium]